MIDPDRNVLPELILKYNVDVEEDLNINQMNIKESSMQTPGLKTKWLMTYINERRLLTVLKNRKYDLVQSYIDANMGPGKIIPTLKIQAEHLPNVRELNDKITTQQDIVDYLEGVKDVFQKLDFTIKNVVDIIKLENSV
jgi:hypothetical protein